MSAVELLKQAARRLCEEAGEPWAEGSDAEFDEPFVVKLADTFAELVLAAKKPKPDHMTDEAWRQLTEVIPFRMRQVENGHHMSLAVMVSSIDKIAGELGIQGDVRQGCWPVMEGDAAELEQENRLMRARMERLQAERTTLVEAICKRIGQACGHNSVAEMAVRLDFMPERPCVVHLPADDTEGGAL